MPSPMKTINSLGCLILAALSIYGCSKAEGGGTENTAGTHTLTFMAQKDIDTRTFVVEGDRSASYYWGYNDNECFHIYENDIPAISQEMTLSEGGRVASFKATFMDTDATSFTYSALYARDITTAGEFYVPNYQFPTPTSFDSEADVLVSMEDVSLKDFARIDENTVIRFKMKRLASVNKITVKGIEPGEAVYGLALYADQPLGGYFYDDLGEDVSKYSLQKVLWLDCSGWDESKRIIGPDGSFSVYFLSQPIEEASTTVRVWSGKNIYKRDLASKLTLETGVFRRFGVVMKEVSPQLDVSTSELDFSYDDPSEYTGRTKQITITNVGDKNAYVNLTSSGTHSSYYSISPMGERTLGPGETLSVSVHFTFESGDPYLLGSPQAELLVDTIFIETASFTYEVSVFMRYFGGWETMQ